MVIGHGDGWRTPHLHYEQIHDGSVVVSVVHGVTWSDYLKRNQTSTNNC
ncbi:hypothetical protein GCM10010169_44720 [Micromonospora fulviviridis]|nr:hypothetical protein [Micromonospora fulviviridis]GGR95206.1 hypothetical protein GCM10010169_44720 [Micromonospora fulviviridis]